MKFEEITEFIKSQKNRFEELHGIRTISVKCVERKENWAIFLGEKSDMSFTVFYARKGYRNIDENWSYFCPSESEAERGFLSFIDFYKTANDHNGKRRRRI